VVSLFWISLGKTLREALADKTVALAGRLREARAIEDRDLPPTALDRIGTLQQPDGIRD